MPQQAKQTIKIIKQNVGIDISKDDFKVSFWQLKSDQSTRIKGTRTFKNILSDFEALIRWMTKKAFSDVSIQVTVEATGVYHESLVHFLHDRDYRVNVVLPNMSKAYAKSLNLKTKTDKVDANMLGQMGIERDLRQWQPKTANMHSLKQLTRDRVQLLDEKTATSNRLHALKHSYQPNKAVMKRMKKRIKLLDSQLKEVEAQVVELVQADEKLSLIMDNICKVKGLGIITVATILAETNGFELFTSREQVVSYAGYDVVQRESGASVKGKTRISKKGNSFIRRALYFPALSVVQHEPPFKQMFLRIIKRNSIKMVAYVAVQRKLLLLIYALVKKQQPYDPEYYKKDTMTSLENMTLVET